MIWRHKQINMNGKNNPNYKHGKCMGGKRCIDCGKKLSVQAKLLRTKRCYKCSYKIRSKQYKESGNPQHGKINIYKYTIIHHHINLNTKNNNKKNLLVLTQSIHAKLHHRADDYLVTKGFIYKYIKWFIKNVLSKREFNFIKKHNEN